jgi:hypothetical protein
MRSDDLLHGLHCSNVSSKTRIMIKKALVLIITILTFPHLTCIAPEPGQKEREAHAITMVNRYAEIKEEEYRREQFMIWRDSLYYYESGNNWRIINAIGCMGLPQFMGSTLAWLGYEGITPAAFRRDPGIFPVELQNKAFEDYVKVNWNALKAFEPYIGTMINGTVITKSGLLAACHLAGVRNVQKYLLANGREIHIDGWVIKLNTGHIGIRHNAADINNTSISDYIKKFSGYNI